VHTSNMLSEGRKDSLNISYTDKGSGKNWINHSVLANCLRKEMLRSNGKGLRNAATLLIQFYSEPRNTHKHLASITGMTMSGVAKQIYMLKKRQLIVRHGHQTYLLT